MSVSPTKWAAICLFLLITALSSWAALDRVERLGRASEGSIAEPFALAASLLDAHHGATRVRASLQDITLAGSVEAARALRPTLETAETGLRASLQVAMAPHLGNEAVMAPLMRDLAAWSEARDAILELVEAGRWADAHAVLAKDGEAAFERLHDSLSQVMAAERDHAKNLAEQARGAERSAWWAAMALALATGTALAALGIGTMLFMRTHRPLMRLRHALLALAEGKDPKAIPYVGHPGAIGAMARAVADFKRSLAERDAANAALRLSEDCLRKAVDEARRADDSKRRFLAAASHDLRQPMQAIRLFLDVLDRRVSDTGDRLVLNGAMRALAAGEDLLRDYLDVSVLEAGIVHPAISDFAVAPVLQQLGLECSPSASQRGLELRVVPCGAVVRSDARLVYRLLRNLVVNAVRYTVEGGIVLGCRRRGDSLRIEVWDSGIGIPADKLSAVFEDFVQLGNPERDRAKGMGLGLSVVERTARLLGHRTEVRSVVGKGSMFAVILPLVRSQPTSGSLDAACAGDIQAAA